MAVTRDRIQKLNELGLSEGAARVYLALLELGTAQAAEISTLSRVPTSKIYHILEQLHEKGLVEILPEFPRAYAAMPIDHYLSRLQRSHEEAAARIEQERERAALHFRPAHSDPSRTGGAFAIVRSRRSVVDKMIELLSTASRDYLVLGSHGSAGRMANDVNEFRLAHERGVRARLLLPAPPVADAPIQTLAPYMEIRVRSQNQPPGGAACVFSIADGERAILAHFAPDDENSMTGKDTGIFIEQPAIVAALRALAQAQWEHATPHVALMRKVNVDARPA